MPKKPVTAEENPAAGVWEDMPSFSPPLSKEKPAEQEVVDLSKFPGLDDTDVQFGAAAEEGGADIVQSVPPPPVRRVPVPSYIKPIDQVQEGVSLNSGENNDPQQQPLQDPNPGKIPTVDPPPQPGVPASEEEKEPEKPAPPSTPGPVPTGSRVDEPAEEEEEELSATAERRLMLRILEKAITNQNQLGITNVQPVVANSMSYEQMAVALLSVGCEQYLPAIREIAHNLTEDSIAAWLNALVSLHGDQGDLGDIAYNSDWRKTLREQGPTMATNYLPAAIATCEHCSHSFRPPLGGNIRQRFCCNVCGKKAAGYGDEPVPHSPDCTTEVGKQLRAALVAATPPSRVSHQ